ncbi:MAG: HDOD domain-containing protein [Planctomycetes bacterium]|nr:HDOD domain-containing protein [Planctomycetota bacterium]
MTTATSELSQVFARQIADKRLTLPTMPGTASEVMALCQQEDTDAAKLSSVIHNDQTIASNVLRVANSAAYVGTVPCASLQQAVSRLGLQLITEIAMAVSVRGRMFGNPQCADLLAALWQHSVLTGFFTKEIARMRRRNVEIAFLCGLLHDVGKAVLLDNIDRVLGKRELKIPVPDMLAAIEEQHIPAGRMLSIEWKLPDQIAESIEHHHDFESAERFQDMAMTVCLADLLSHVIVPNVFYTELSADDLRAHPVLAGLNMYSDQVDELLALKERALAVTEGMQ